MNLTASEMKHLDDDAREIATSSCRGYLADARQCLRDTGDPIAPLELLRAMWNTNHAGRRYQKAALSDAGVWLDDRLRREPQISASRLELELGWLHRLVAVHCTGRSDRDRQDWIPPREPPFGAHLDQLRKRRQEALARAAGGEPARSAPAAPKVAPTPARPDHLPDTFEVCFSPWQEALDVLKTARKRVAQGKEPKERLLSVKPIATELQPLAADLVCSMRRTDGMSQLLTLSARNTSELPSFWIAVSDLVPHEGKRLALRISLDAARLSPGTPTGPEPRSP